MPSVIIGIDVIMKYDVSFSDLGSEVMNRV